jgi:hypothetical protein
LEVLSRATVAAVEDRSGPAQSRIGIGIGIDRNS